MGKVSNNWLMPAHSGSPCHHDNIYTKMNKKTGKCYSVKLCNPNQNWSEDQIAHRNTFGSISKALTAWINQNKVSTATDHAVYQALKLQFDRQNKYATIRGYMMAKNMAAVGTNGVVTITIGTYTATVTNGVVAIGNNTSGGGGDTQGGGDNPGGGTSGGGSQY